MRSSNLCLGLCASICPRVSFDLVKCIFSTATLDHDCESTALLTLLLT